MKLFVTGCNGYIGRSFSDYARSLGHDVFGVDKKGVWSVDLANGTVLNNVLGKCQPDWVVHLAATPGTGNGKDDVGSAAMQDVFNTRNLLQAIQLSGCRRILFASTGSVYRASNSALTEYSATEPNSFYAAGKLACEGFISAWCAAQNGIGVALRLGTIIGPGNIKGFCKDFVRKLKQDPGSIEIIGNGLQEKSYLHINDLTRCMMRVMANTDEKHFDSDFNVLNVAHECEPYNTVKCLNTVAGAMGLDRPAIIIGDKAYGDVQKINLCTDKLYDETDWLPVMSIGEAINDNVKWLLDNPEVFE